MTGKQQTRTSSLMGVLLAVSLMLSPFNRSAAGDAVAATMYKRPQCTCCDGHASHLRDNGYKVTIIETDDLSRIKQQHDVPEAFEGCHTLLVGGYVVEGHVPASVIDKLLKEKPAIRGISLPGMPEGSPGMGGEKAAPFTIYELSGGAPRIFAVE